MIFEGDLSYWGGGGPLPVEAAMVPPFLRSSLRMRLAWWSAHKQGCSHERRTDLQPGSSVQAAACREEEKWRKRAIDKNKVSEAKHQPGCSLSFHAGRWKTRHESRHEPHWCYKRTWLNKIPEHIKYWWSKACHLKRKNPVWVVWGHKKGSGTRFTTRQYAGVLGSCFIAIFMMQDWSERQYHHFSRTLFTSDRILSSRHWDKMRFALPTTCSRLEILKCWSGPVVAILYISSCFYGFYGTVTVT